MQHKNAAYFKRVEDFIDKYTAKHKVSPTNREIAEGTGLSPATVSRYMKVMREENVLDYSGIRDIITRKQRKIRANTSSLIPVLGAVSCGVPKFAEENIEEYVTLPVSLFGDGDRTWIMMRGLSFTGNFRAKKRERPTEREVNTAVFMLRAKQLGFSLEELDQLEEGQIMDCIIESGNDFCADEYCKVATQKDFDKW